MDFLVSILAALRSPCYCRVLIFLTGLVAVAILHLPVARAEPSPPGQDRWPTCDRRSAMQKISFVHISDMHANYNPEADGSSPISRVRGYYEAVKKENPFTVFSNSGDDYEKGSIAEELSHGRSTREVVQALGYDVRTLGNHDFAWGIKELLLFSNDPKAVVLSTNTRINRGIDSPLRDIPAGFSDFTVMTVGCVKIGFFGLTARPYAIDGGQHNGPVYPDLPALEMDFDFVGISKEIIAKYRQEVDILVLVSHMGLTDDIAVAEQTNGIDLILGGHSHTTLEKSLRVKDTAIVHVGAQAEHIGRYDLLYDLEHKVIADSQFQLVANTPETIQADPGINKAVAKILHHYRQEISETVAEVKTDQSPRAIAGIAARAAVQRLQIDAAFVGFGSVWQEWQAGRLTRQDILDAFRVEREPVGTPGTSSLYLMEVTGADLLRARTILKDAAYWGPTAINPLTFYTVAMQKTLALNQQQIFSRPIAIAPPRPVAELWEVVATFAGDLTNHNLALDDGSDNRWSTDLVALLTGQRPEHPAL
ncbi:MAG: metallophosphoesterase [Desulforhopalus sp.]|nr:metallophosphoesterase [Desulforhopalus sp.]